MPFRRVSGSDKFPTQDQIRDIIKGANHELVNEAEILKGEIQAKFYSGKRPDSLGRRTGEAARGWRVKENSKSVTILNNVKHADHSEKRTIKPTKGQYLAIPVGPALTRAGVSRYKGPRDSALPKLSVAPSKKSDTLLLFDKNSRKGFKESIYFVLKKEVTIPARTAGLTPFVFKESNAIKKRIGNYIFEALNRASEV